MFPSVNTAVLRVLFLCALALPFVAVNHGLRTVLIDFQSGEVWPWIIFIAPAAAAVVPLAERARRRWGTACSPLDATLLAAPLLVVYSLVSIPLRHQEAWQWFDTLLATVFSVAAAFATGIQLMKHQQKMSEDSRRSQLDLLLQRELSEITNTLAAEDGLAIRLLGGKDLLIISTVQLGLVALDDAIRSGLYNENTTRLMMELARVQQTRSWEVTHLYQALTGGITTDAQYKVVAHIASNLENSKGKILQLAGNLSELLTGHRDQSESPPTP